MKFLHIWRALQLISYIEPVVKFYNLSMIRWYYAYNLILIHMELIWQMKEKARDTF